MGNPGMNWAGFVGAILVLAALPGAVFAGLQVALLLGHRKHRSAKVAVVTAYRFILLFARLILLPLVGGIFFYQGWRLDPLLQFGVFLLAAGYLGELAVSMVYDYRAWQNRKHIS